jgi:hypothetical protein
MAGKIIADIIEAPYDAIRMNVANVTVLTANSSGLTYIPTGNVNINVGSTTSLTLGNVTVSNLLTTNGGIKFPATQVSSTDGNTLDDYEEGTWSPTISDLTTFSGAGLGHYRKIGNLVIAQLQFYNANISAITAGNALYISGLPYAQGSGGASHQLLSTPTNTLYGSILAHDMNGATTAQLYYSGGTDRVNWSTLTRTAWGGSSVSLYGTYIYRTAS